MNPISAVFVRCLICTFFAALLGCTPTKPSPPQNTPHKVLFVGNSLTYVGNLPAVFDALCEANGKTCHSDMLAQGGVTLTQHATEGHVTDVLQAKTFDAVVLQERGGDVIGMAFGSKQTPEAIKKASAEATQQLVDATQKHQQKAFYLGTYQSHPEVSQSLEAAEKQLAKQMALPAVTYSNDLVRLKTNHPKHAWFHQDGGHPGAALTLLQAVMLYQAMFDACPGTQGFSVNAPLYEPNAKFSLRTLASTQTLDTPPQSHVAYDQPLMAAVMESCLQRQKTGSTP